MTNTPDHWNAYVTLGASALSIVGTLAGLLVGSYTQKKRDDAQRDYTDRTRFHDTRIEVYQKFVDASIRLVSCATVWSKGLMPDSFPNYVGSLELFRPYTSAYSVTILVASSNVLTKVTDLNDCISELMDITAHDEMREAAKRASEARKALVFAVREELGIQ